MSGVPCHAFVPYNEVYFLYRLLKVGEVCFESFEVRALLYAEIPLSMELMTN